MAVVVEYVDIISEDEMIAAFAGGEIDSPRYGRYWIALLDQFGRQRSLIDTPDLHSSEENWIRRSMLAQRRGYPDQMLFQGLPSDVVWHRGLVRRDGIGDVLYAKFGNWLKISNGTRLVMDGAANVDTIPIGDDGTNDFIREAERLIAAGTDVGRLFLVSTGIDGPFVLLEGHARATGHALNVGVIQAPVPVLVGLSRDMADWCLW